MSWPPTCLRIDDWNPHDFAQTLFPLKGLVTIKPSSATTTGLYDLTWKNQKSKDRHMSLLWTDDPDGGGKFSGEEVTIHEPSGTETRKPLMTVNVEIIIEENGNCTGTLFLAGTQPPPTPNKPPGTPTPGIFVAQADPGHGRPHA